MTIYVAHLLIYSLGEKIPKVVSKSEIKNRSSLMLSSDDLWHVTAEADRRAKISYVEGVIPETDFIVIAYGKKGSKRFKTRRVRRQKDYGDLS